MFSKFQITGVDGTKLKDVLIARQCSSLFKVGQAKRVKMKILYFLSKKYQVLIGNCPLNFSKILFGDTRHKMENWCVFS